MLQPSSTIYQLQMEWGVQILQCSFAGVFLGVSWWRGPSHRIPQMCTIMHFNSNLSKPLYFYKAVETCWNNIGTPSRATTQPWWHWRGSPLQSGTRLWFGVKKFPLGIHEIHGRKLVRHPSSCASPLVCVENTWSENQKLLQAKFSQHCWKLSEYPEQRNTKSKVLIKIAGFLAGA